MPERRPRTARRVVAGAALLAGALLGGAAPAYAATPGPTGDLTATTTTGSLSAAVVVTCGGLTEAAAQAAGYTIRNNASSPTGVVVVGTPGPDWMVGSAFIDILDGQGGNDPARTWAAAAPTPTPAPQPPRRRTTADRFPSTTPGRPLRVAWRPCTFPSTPSCSTSTERSSTPPPR